MCRDLRRARAIDALFRQMLFNLLAARTRRFEIFLRVTFDLGRAVLSRLDLVAEFLQTPGSGAASMEEISVPGDAKGEAVKEGYLDPK